MLAKIVLVIGIPTPLKNMKVSWEYYSQYMEKKMFQTTNQYEYCQDIVDIPSGKQT